MTAKVGQCLQKAIEIMFPKNFCADPCARALATITITPNINHNNNNNDKKCLNWFSRGR